jgi:DNA-binding CsgD family transcriptional regulator/tetratricopeptide (TPR) repeat protein
MRVLRGRALSTATSVPFRPLAEALFSAFRDGPPPDLARLGPYRDTLGLLVPEWSAGPAAAVQESRLLVQEGAVRLLALVAAQAGALLVIEDLHWADAETLGIVEYFADNLSSERVLCVCTVRSDEESPALALARNLQARRNVLPVELARLSAAEMTSMTRACLDDAPFAPELSELLVTRAEGIPFLVEEILASCIAAGTLRREQGSWILRQGADRLVPDTVRGLVRERMNRLDPGVRSVVAAAAVLGRRFEWSLLPAMLGSELGEVLPLVRTAVNAQLISPEIGGSEEAFRFRHSLTRDAVLDDLLPPECAALARAATVALEAAHPGLPGEWCERAAALWELAGDADRASRLLLESGRRALARTALASAETTLERAVALAGTNLALVAEIDEQLVGVLSLAGKTDRAQEVGRRLLLALNDLGAPPERVGAAYLAFGRAHTAAGDVPQARGHLAQAERLADLAGDEVLLARTWSTRAQAEFLRGDFDAAATLAGEALAAAERIGAPEIACEALDVLGRGAQGLRRFDLAAETFNKARRIAEAAGLTLWRIRALLELGTVEMLESGGIETLVAARALAEQGGAVSALASIEQNLSWAHLFAARLGDLVQANDHCLELCRQFHLELLPHALVIKGIAQDLRGDREASEAAMYEALAASDDPDVLAGVWGWRGMAWLLREEKERAMAAFEQAMGYIRGGEIWLNWFFIGARAVLLEVEDRDGQAAREELRDAPMPLSCWSEAALAYADAVALGRMGRPAEAQEALGRGDAQISWAPLLFHLLRRLAAEAAIVDGWGEPAAWLREAMTFFAELGQDRAAAACRGLLRKAGAPLPRRRPSQPQVPPELRSLGVTAREMDVLRLLAEGLANPEIARRLFLSPRTVETHVTSLLRRAGATNRGQLISLASRHLSTSPPTTT